jgi:hypothetical protein
MFCPRGSYLQLPEGKEMVIRAQNFSWALMNILALFVQSEVFVACLPSII